MFRSNNPRSKLKSTLTSEACWPYKINVGVSCKKGDTKTLQMFLILLKKVENPFTRWPP